MNPHEEFKKEVGANIKGLGEDTEMQDLSRQWCKEIARHKYAYNFSWLGRPAIQFPNDAWALQELVWKVRPDLIIETGIAHGGSLVLSASMLALLDITDAIESGAVFDPRVSGRSVLGVDIDIRAHNRAAIEEHPMASRIQMIEGSSIAADTIVRVAEHAQDYDRVMVCLDSNHTHDHVLAELEAYAHLTSVGSYCVVYDTLIEDMPAHMFPDRAWGPGDNPKTAVWEYLRSHPEFEIDQSIHNKLQITVAPDGYLERIK
jgi:cephalosporin hydroxylase